jgi:transcriptional regulator with XRE-family HTH domain
MMVVINESVKKRLNTLVGNGVSQENVDDFIVDVSEGRLSTTPVKSTDYLKPLGLRMQEAREIAGYSQVFAAKKMGYANSSRLNKIEKGVDIKSISIPYLMRASKLYGVSIDFLLGVSKDWDRDVNICHIKGITNLLAEEWGKAHIKDVNAINYLGNKIAIIGQAFDLMWPAMADIRKALIRFIELNPKFNDMRGGASLVGSIDRAELAEHTVKGLLKRFQSDYRSRNMNQLSLFDFDFD